MSLQPNKAEFLFLLKKYSTPPILFVPTLPKSGDHTLQSLLAATQQIPPHPMNNAVLALFRGSSDVDTYMQQARALKKEKQIYPGEVKHLIKKLEGSLGRVQYVDKRRRISRSSFSVLEVETCLNTLRSMLLALEILNRSRENGDVSAALREQAWYKLCYSISQL